MRAAPVRRRRIALLALHAPPASGQCAGNSVERLANRVATAGGEGGDELDGAVSEVLTAD